MLNQSVEIVRSVSPKQTRKRKTLSVTDKEKIDQCLALQFKDGIPLRSRHHNIETPFSFKMKKPEDNSSEYQFSLDQEVFNNPTEALLEVLRMAGIQTKKCVNGWNELDGFMITNPDKPGTWIKLSTIRDRYILKKEKKVSKKKQEPVKETPQSVKIVVLPSGVPLPKTFSSETKSDKKEEGVIDEKYMCKICFESEADQVLIPCGHLHTCILHTPSIGELCPLCRTRVEKVIQVFK